MPRKIYPQSDQEWLWVLIAAHETELLNDLDLSLLPSLQWKKLDDFIEDYYAFKGHNSNRNFELNEALRLRADALIRDIWEQIENSLNTLGERRKLKIACAFGIRYESPRSKRLENRLLLI